MAQSSKNYNRPSLDEWKGIIPKLKKIGQEHKGACPSCGGGGKADRFWIKDDGTFGCRRGCTFEQIMRAAGRWNDAPPKANGKLNGSAKPRETRRQYVGTMGTTFEVVRIDGPAGKRVWQTPSGVQLQDGEQWLPYLAGKPKSDGAPILLVEGELTADAAAKALPKLEVYTWQRAPRDTDWSFCAGRQVWIWPDNDLAGFAKARQVCREIRKHKPAAIQIVHANSGNLKDDAADFVARGEPLAPFLEGAWPLGTDNMVLRPQVSISDDGLFQCFGYLGLDVRYNLRAMRADILAKSGLKCADLPGKQWQPLTDRIADSLAEHIRKTFSVIRPPRRKDEGLELVPAVFGRDRWQTCLNANLARAQVDPFRQWLDELTPAPSDRLDRWLAELFNVEAESQQFIRWASRYLFLGAVQRTFRPGAKIDEIPVFVGEQGLGKSAIGLAILPAFFQDEGHGDALVLADDPKKFAESLQGKVIVEASEMAGMGRADLERLKSNITRQNDGSVRLAYRHNPEPLPRRAVFYGTSNDRECLPNDSTGNRRFVVVELEGEKARQSVESYFAEHRAELWAAAVHAHQEGERANLPRDLFPAQRKANTNFRRADVIVEDEVARLNHNEFPDGAT